MRTMPALACAAVLIAIVAAGCAYRAPVVPPTGRAITATSAPMNLQMRTTRFRRASGEASSVCWFGLWSVGDSSIKAAAENGNIGVVAHADTKLVSILGVYVKQTTVVYGRRQRNPTEN